MSICGLDFGTSNTTLGTVIHDIPVLAALEGDHVTIPSAIFYKADGGAHVGRRAIEAYVEGDPGRPVHFVDDNPAADAKAEATLRGIAESVGFRDVSFQFEPIAAALDYER